MTDLLIALTDEDAQAVHVTVTDVLINWGEDIEPRDRQALRNLLEAIIRAKIKASKPWTPRSKVARKPYP